jgi:hypothetical protein
MIPEDLIETCEIRVTKRTLVVEVLFIDLVDDSGEIGETG